VRKLIASRVASVRVLLLIRFLFTPNWGELERSPQFGGSSSSSAMLYSAYVPTYVRTRNFSYSDLNPTGLSPRTGYFEVFQSYTAVIYSKFYGPFDSHRLTIFHATCHEIYSSCQRKNGSWNGQYYLQWSVLSPSQFYFTRFLSELRFKF
jgi:hypothetical protein